MRPRAEPAATLLDVVRRALHGPVRRALYAIAGAPDYERYLECARRAGDGSPPLTAAEFERQRLHARYRSPGARCC
jgi:uncharacterized short protein YbdD (DUF466 family)